MFSTDLLAEVVARTPKLRGSLAANVALAPLTTFKVGGSAELFFKPADEEDLAYFMSVLPAEIPVAVIGKGSNLLVRDGGVRGVVITLTQSAFRNLKIEDDFRVRAGAGVLVARMVTRAANDGIDGLLAFVGIPGTLGGAIKMNAGAPPWGDTADVIIEARGVDRAGNIKTLSKSDLGLSYRKIAAKDIIFTEALI